MAKPYLLIKVGGAFVECNELHHGFFQQLGQSQQRFNVVLVHGGGNLVDQLLEQLDFNIEKKHGLRVTPLTQLPYVSAVLAGSVNKTLVSQAQVAGLQSVGLSLLDGATCQCIAQSADLGAVGEVTSVNTHLLKTLLDAGYLPVLSSIGNQADGQLLNVNADQAATALAQALQADLLLLSDVPGVLNQGQLIPQLSAADSEQLVAQQVIQGGMLVKVQAAQTAANTLQRPVTIASWRQHQDLRKLLHQQPFGTQVLAEHTES